MSREVIKLNLIPAGEMPVYHASQFDTGRLITCELYNGEDAYNVPEGYTIELHCRKVDNNIVTLASSSISDNVVQFASTEQLTACNGMNLCEVVILDDGYRLGTLNFWLEVEVDPLKGGITSTSEIYDLYDQIEDITEEVIGDNYYNKTQVDDLLDAKADKSTTYTKTEVNTLLNSKADTSSVYTKSETNTLLAAKADASDVYTKAQVETKLAAKADAADVYTKDETDTLLSAKADANGVYNKTEIDSMVDDLEDAIDLKADQSTTYTKTEVDTALALKANAATTYTKTEVDTALALKANAADVYTKAETDAAIEEAIEDILPIGTAGPSAIASFDTGYASDLVECVTTLTPSLTGYTAVNLTACGVNLFDIEKFLTDEGVTYTKDGEWVTFTPITALYVNHFKLPITVAKSLLLMIDTDNTTATNFRVCVYDNTNSYVATTESGNPSSTTMANKEIGFVGFDWSAVGTVKCKVCIIDGTTAPSTYTAYTGNAYAIALGDTYYGGVLDVTTGVLTVTHVDVDMGDLSWSYDSSVPRFISNEILELKNAINNDTIPNIMCDIYKTMTYNSFILSPENYSITNPIANTKISVRNTDYSDANTFKTNMTGHKIVYELATPFDIDLTPEVISAIVGENNVYSDTGDTTVKYKDSIQHYIDKRGT